MAPTLGVDTPVGLYLNAQDPSRGLLTVSVTLGDPSPDVLRSLVARLLAIDTVGCGCGERSMETCFCRWGSPGLKNLDADFDVESGRGGGGIASRSDWCKSAIDILTQVRRLLRIYFMVPSTSQEPMNRTAEVLVAEVSCMSGSGNRLRGNRLAAQSVRWNRYLEDGRQ